MGENGTDDLTRVLMVEAERLFVSLDRPSELFGGGADQP
jgi:hypothetical protein